MKTLSILITVEHDPCAPEVIRLTEDEARAMCLEQDFSDKPIEDVFTNIKNDILYQWRNDPYINTYGLKGVRFPKIYVSCKHITKIEFWIENE